MCLDSCAIYGKGKLNDKPPMDMHRVVPHGTLAIAVAALFTGLAGEASAGRIVGKDGTIYACYKAGGKHKGAVRLVAKGMHCRRSGSKRWRGP